jgi:hypothetical protein
MAFEVNLENFCYTNNQLTKMNFHPNLQHLIFVIEFFSLQESLFLMIHNLIQDGVK